MALVCALCVFGFFLTSKTRIGVQAQQDGVEVVTQSLKNDIRWAMWKASLAVVADSPWQGRGFGIHAFQSLKNKQIPDHLFIGHAHNLLINKAIQLGIPGLLAFLIFYFSPLVFLSVNLKKEDARPIACAAIAILAGVFLKNMTDDFFNRDSAYLYWIIMGAFFAYLQNIDQKNDEKISYHPSR